MLNKIIRYYNQNRRKILIFILIVASIIIFIKLLNELTKKQNEEKYNNYLNEKNTITSPDKSYLQNSQSTKTNQINNNTISTSGYSKLSEIQIINQFVTYCNENDFYKAYEMITNDCKKVVFPTIYDFQKNYIQKIFYQNRTASIEKSMYNSNIYKVKYYTNILSAGEKKQEDTFEDYIKVIEEEGEYKLSLNSFLYIGQINKTKEENSIYMKIIQKEVHVDFEIYQILITNKTNNTILLSTREDNNSVCMVDVNNMQYTSNIDEQEQKSLILNSQDTTILNLKFNKLYNAERKVREIIFNDIISNYEQYQNGESEQRVKFRISI